MAKRLYELLVPSTSLLGEGATFQILPGRTCVLSGEYEGKEGEVISLKLIFEGVEAFKCTYYKACPVQLINVAYDKVVHLGATDWLGEIKERLLQASPAQLDLHQLCHLAIYFDDGPLYDFICRVLRVESVVSEPSHANE